MRITVMGFLIVIAVVVLLALVVYVVGKGRGETGKGDE